MRIRTSSYDIVDDLAFLIVGLGKGRPDLRDAAEVTGVPENMPPHGALEALVHGQDALSLYCLGDDVGDTVVLPGRRLILKPDLDELKRNDTTAVSNRITLVKGPSAYTRLSVAPADAPVRTSSPRDLSRPKAIAE